MMITGGGNPIIVAETVKNVMRTLRNTIWLVNWTLIKRTWGERRGQTCKRKWALVNPEVTLVITVIIFHYISVLHEDPGATSWWLEPLQMFCLTFKIIEGHESVRADEYRRVEREGQTVRDLVMVCRR